MRIRSSSRGAARLLVTALALAASAAQAVVVWDESVSGDLSNSGLAPTALALGPGSNVVRGLTGRAVAGGTVDRDYFSITVPSGSFLNSMTVLPGTVGQGPTLVSFVGLQAGAQVTVPTSATTAAGLMGYWLYGAPDVGKDLLPLMAVPSNGSAGFGVPLPAGVYSFWVQDTGVGDAVYGFDLGVSAVPAPPASLLMALGLAGLAGWRRRQR
jgi:MYXO-CTERM domain-containing protein